MKAKFDFKHNIARIKPENLDDLWLLSQILKEGDLVKARTLRSVEVKRGEEKVKVGKKPVTLKIQIEKIELNGKLKLLGKIVEGPKDIEMGYHSISISPGDEITVEKEWKKYEVDRIRKAQIKPIPVLVCVLDEREADIYLIENTPKHIANIKSTGLGKEEGKSGKAEYFGEIKSILKKSDVENLIIAGPGFAKEDLNKELKGTLDKKIFVDSLSHTGEVGLQELLKRKTIEKFIKESRISRETELVEKLLEEIAKDGLAVYGREETRQAVEAGAVKELLVSDKKVRDFEDILELAEKTRTEVHIISSSHQSGEKLLGLGGIGGILRFKIDF